MASRALLSLGDRAERPFSLTPVTCGPDGLGPRGPNGPLWTQLDPTFAQHPPPDHPASIPQGRRRQLCVAFRSWACGAHSGELPCPGSCWGQSSAWRTPTCRNGSRGWGAHLAGRGRWPHPEPGERGSLGRCRPGPSQDTGVQTPDQLWGGVSQGESAVVLPCPAPPWGCPATPSAR